LSKEPKVEENWSSELQTLEGHSHWVWSVAFSQVGQILASGPDDETIKLWDPTTGALKHTLSVGGIIASIEFFQASAATDYQTGAIQYPSLL
jgi:WD40 repeat protein